MLVIILLLVFLSVTLFAYAGGPLVYQGAIAYNKRRSNVFSKKYDRLMMSKEIQNAARFYVIGPFALAAAGIFFFPEGMRIFGLIFGLILGFILPRVYVGFLLNRRKKRFDDQLIDALLIMSSSFRGGLSLIQAMEAVVEEMPDPIRHEFSIVLGENKMGVTLEETLNRLDRRMPSISLKQMITAVLLARETGGNLPLIFTRIINSTRERKKVKQNLDTLTVQGKIQGFVMSVLPIGFFMMLSVTNRRFFDVMVNTETGQKLLVICAILWTMGAFFIWKISRFKGF